MSQRRGEGRIARGREGQEGDKHGLLSRTLPPPNLQSSPSPSSIGEQGAVSGDACPALLALFWRERAQDRIKFLQGETQCFLCGCVFAGGAPHLAAAVVQQVGLENIGRDLRSSVVDRIQRRCDLPAIEQDFTLDRTHFGGELRRADLLAGGERLADQRQRLGVGALHLAELRLGAQRRRGRPPSGRAAPGRATPAP